MNEEVEALCRKARDGDKKAFGALVEKFHQMVFVLAFGILNQRDAALDAVQDTFLKAYQELRRFEGKSQFKTWLYRIAINTAIDHQRKRKPTVRIDEGDKEEGDAPSIILQDRRDNPRELAQKAELKAGVQKAIESLSVEHRAILVLREWNDLSYAEIAASLGLSMGTVMSRLFYARKKLAEVLKKDI